MVLELSLIAFDLLSNIFEPFNFFSFRDSIFNSLSEKKTGKIFLSQCLAVTKVRPCLRTSRIVIPSHPHHVISEATITIRFDDNNCYLDTPAEWKQWFGYKVFSFCLMTKHVHLVIDSGDDPSSPW